jgi:hypothetical protein
LLRYRFWEIVAATIEERLRLYGKKTRCFCPQNKCRINGDRLLFLKERESLYSWTEQQEMEPGPFFSAFFSDNV